jgi:PAS domain S-box-containing protein
MDKIMAEDIRDRPLREIPEMPLAETSEKLQREIQQREKAEAQLKQQEQRLSLLLNQSALAAIEWNANLEIVAWNSAAEKVFGWTAPEAIALHPTDLILSLNVKRREIPLTQDPLTSIGGKHHISENVTKDGKLIICEWHNTPLVDDQGKIITIFSLVNDITERRQTREALLEKEEFLRSIYEGVDYPIFVIDVDADGTYRCVDLNPVAQQVFGINLDENSAVLAPELFLPELAKGCLKSSDKCVHRGQTIQYEKVLDIDGKPTWWLTVITPLKDSDGRIYRLVGTCTDITQRKQFEAALQESEAKYRQLAQRESLINRIASQIRASLDFNTVVETAVQELYQVLQLERCAFRLYLPAEIPPVVELIAEAKAPELPSLKGNRVPAAEIAPLIAKMTRKEVTRIEDTLTLADSVERQFFLDTLDYRAVLLVPVHTQSGKMGAISCSHSQKSRYWSDSEVELLEKVAEGLAIALTQAELYQQSRALAASESRKALELQEALQQLQQTQAQLIQQEKMSSLGQLVAGVAHEINNPVSFIYGNIDPAKTYIEDLLSTIKTYQTAYPNPQPEIEEKLAEVDWEFIQTDFPSLLDSMKTGAERIRQIVQALRNFSRPDEAEIKAVDLHESIDGILLILENRLQATPDRPAIQVVKAYGNLPLVECYAREINQVFMNLLLNAIDALEEAPVKQPRIRIVTQVLDEELRIRIIDNGPGINPEIKPRIFEPFYTTKSVGKGTGLGLFIVYKTIKQHGGTIECISEGEKGTEFAIALPRFLKKLP